VALPRRKKVVGGIKSLPTGDEPSFNPNGRHNPVPSTTASSESLHRPVDMRTASRRALRAGGGGETSLDFIPNKNTAASRTPHTSQLSTSAPNASHTRHISSSVPDLLDDTNPHPSPPYLDVYTNGSVYPPNAVRSRTLASSTSDLFEDTPIDQHYRRDDTSSTSDYASQYSLASRASERTVAWNHELEPPQADKRKAKGWFGFKRISRKKSVGSESVGEGPLSPGRKESDTGLLGYYPDISYGDALEMVTGQPRGTYVLFKEELDDYSGQSAVYKLGVSGGRKVKVYPILCTSNGRELQYQLVDKSSSHTSLKSLINHYKTFELSDGITLTQPRLVAGVAVTGVNILRKQPQMARGRLMGRKKY
jgi:hypothetical protein